MRTAALTIIVLLLITACSATQENTGVTVINDSGTAVYVQQCQKPLFGSECSNTGDRRQLAPEATMRAGVPGQNRVVQWWQVLDSKRTLIGCLALQNDFSGNELVFPVSGMKPCPE